jgi:glycylpeptide N-tetradecanoyltransferase
VSQEEIRKALKAADLMKMLDGQKALGNKVGTKALGEHKVGLLLRCARSKWKF